jgi:glycosyltransferase involved in cell wall biosynthesis
MKTVLVCRAEVLRYSETFIAEQIRHIRHWRAVLLGMHAVHGAPTNGIETRLVHAHAPGAMGSMARRFALRLGLTGRGLLAAARAEQPDLVHVHFGTDAVDFWPALRLLDCPLVVTLHGWDINTHADFWREGLRRYIDGKYPVRLRQLGRDHRVRFIAVSDAIRARAIEYGLPEERVSTLYTGIDVMKFSPGGVPVARRQPRILYVGRFVEKKAPEVLVRAFAMILREVPGAALTMVGDGPLLEPARKLAAGLQAPVTFTGALQPQRVLEELHHSRVFVLPSVTARNGDAEGFGMVILEAQAAGVPVVTSARGGAREGIVEGHTGFSFMEGDVKALAAHLLRVLTDDALAERMSLAGPVFVRDRFDIATCTSRLEEFYDATVAEHRNA